MDKRRFLCNKNTKISTQLSLKKQHAKHSLRALENDNQCSEQSDASSFSRAQSQSSARRWSTSVRSSTRCVSHFFFSCSLVTFFIRAADGVCFALTLRCFFSRSLKQTGADGKATRCWEDPDGLCGETSFPPLSLHLFFLDTSCEKMNLSSCDA